MSIGRIGLNFSRSSFSFHPLDSVHAEENLSFVFVGVLFIEKGDVADGADDVAGGAALDLFDQGALFVFEFVESDLDELVGFQGLGHGAHEHVGNALLADNDQRVEVVADFAEVFALCAGEIAHGNFRWRVTGWNGGQRPILAYLGHGNRSKG